MSMLSRKRQLVGKIESVEGVAETLAAADAKLLVYNQKVDFDPEMFDRDPLRSSLTPIGKIAGKRPGFVTFGFPLHGSGSITTEPEWLKYFKGCGCGSNTLETLTIGTVTSGPFTHGETITGGTSSATGRVIKKTADGTTTLYFVTLTGTFESGEVLTGGTSGATATTGSVPSAVGFVLEPISEDVDSLTIAGYEDGMRKLVKGSRGSSKVLFNSGKPVMVEKSFSGVEAGVSDISLLSGISYEDTEPPVFLSASISCDGVSFQISELEIDINNSLAQREDVTDSRGIKSFTITERQPLGSFNPEMLKVATHDFHSKWFNNTKMELSVAFGSTSGNKFEFYASAIQYTKIEDADRDGLQLAQCTFDLTGTMDPGDDEFAILIL